MHSLKKLKISFAKMLHIGYIHENLHYYRTYRPLYIYSVQEYRQTAQE